MREHSGHPYINQREGERERERERVASSSLHLQTSTSPPTCLLHPLFIPPTLLLLSSTSSSRPWDCVTSAQFQINRLRRVMKGRGGYERWGGCGERRGTRVSMTTAQDSCLWNEQMCVCVCVCDGSRLAVGRHRHIFFIKVRISHDVTHIHTTRTYTNAHCCETYCHITPSYSISQPNKVCVKGRNYNMA